MSQHPPASRISSVFAHVYYTTLQTAFAPDVAGGNTRLREFYGTESAVAYGREDERQQTAVGPASIVETLYTVLQRAKGGGSLTDFKVAVDKVYSVRSTRLSSLVVCEGTFLFPGAEVQFHQMFHLVPTPHRSETYYVFAEFLRLQAPKDCGQQQQPATRQQQQNQQGARPVVAQAAAGAASSHTNQQQQQQHQQQATAPLTAPAAKSRQHKDPVSAPAAGGAAATTTEMPAPRGRRGQQEQQQSTAPMTAPAPASATRGGRGGAVGVASQNVGAAPRGAAASNSNNFNSNNNATSSTAAAASSTRGGRGGAAERGGRGGGRGGGAAEAAAPAAAAGQNTRNGNNTAQNGSAWAAGAPASVSGGRGGRGGGAAAAAATTTVQASDATRGGARGGRGGAAERGGRGGAERGGRGGGVASPTTDTNAVQGARGGRGGADRGAARGGRGSGERGGRAGGGAAAAAIAAATDAATGHAFVQLTGLSEVDYADIRRMGIANQVEVFAIRFMDRNRSAALEVKNAEQAAALVERKNVQIKNVSARCSRYTKPQFDALPKDGEKKATN